MGSIFIGISVREAELLCLFRICRGSQAVDDEPCDQIAGRLIFRPPPTGPKHGRFTAIERFAAAINGLTPGSARSAETSSRTKIRTQDVASSPSITWGTLCPLRVRAPHLTAYTGLADGTESLRTRRWSEVDSNSRSR